jgi:BolA protein
VTAAEREDELDALLGEGARDDLSTVKLCHSESRFDAAAVPAGLYVPTYKVASWFGGTTRALDVLPATTMDRIEELKRRIATGVSAQRVDVQDDSALHRGHAGARGGAGHYTVSVVAESFAGLDRLARHRAVYAAVGDMIPGEVHALVVRAFTPDEWQAQ